MGSWRRSDGPARNGAGSDQPHDQQQQDGSDCGIDDLRDQAGADVNAEFRKQKACHQRAGDADENVADDAKAGAAHDLAGEPAGDKATNRK